uniref:Uncharacterized protein n=1 Tax=Anguilla anguilla TaxID=7936 RepID=A0A0E9RRP2_ANGAN
MRGRCVSPIVRGWHLTRIGSLS